MDSPVDKIRELHEHLQMLLESRAAGTADSNPGSSPVSGETQDSGAEDAGAIIQRYSTTLSALLERDDQIRRELMKLQRTLSRQTFRGAESARRLVRKLARKAGLNVDLVHAYQKSLQQVGNTEQSRPIHRDDPEISSSPSEPATDHSAPGF